MPARFALSPSRIARFFYHECERNLRYLATPTAKREAEGVPPPPVDASLVTEAILEGGYTWEEQVVTTHLAGRVRVAVTDGPLRDRYHDYRSTVRELAQLPLGHALYQGTIIPPRRFLERYGLNPELVEFRACRPDIVQLTVDDGRTALRVVDVKASEHLKASHRVQVSLYALMLRDMLEAEGVDVPVDLERGAVWLYGKAEPEPFSLTMTMGALEAFLRERLPEILRAPAADVPWHLFFRCEWCEYFQHCRKEAEDVRSVSLVPYLSVGARAYLRQAPWGGAPVHSLGDLRSLLSSKQGVEALEACGSLRGRGERLRRIAETIDDGEPRPHGGSTVGMPVRENVRLVVTLQREPHSGLLYAAGFRRVMGIGAFETGVRSEVFVAETPDACAKTRKAFFEALHEELSALHRYNDGRPWAEQKSLQTYVFDGYERQLFIEALLSGLDDPDVAEKALDLFFCFQDDALAAAARHPGVEIPHPIVVLTRVLREVIALPSPIALRLADVYAALPAPDFECGYAPAPQLNFELANPLRADAIFGAWHHGRVDGLAEVKGELEQRLAATSNVVDGLREKIQERLFAWPRKFVMPIATAFKNPELSRLAFVVRYEAFTGALGAREARARPWSERTRDGLSVPLKYVGGTTWVPEAELLPGVVEETGGFSQYVLVPEGEEGERAQLAFDDHYYRAKSWTPKGVLRLAAVNSIVEDPKSGFVSALQLELRAHKTQSDFEVDVRAVLHPRFTDYNSERVLKRLLDLDAAASSDFVTLLRDPRALATDVNEPPAVAEALARLDHGLTKSQTNALEQFSKRRLTLVWGPPGTGKTFFIAKALHLLASARRACGLGLRIGITAFTHAAVENLLEEIERVGRESGSVLPVYKVGTIRTGKGQKLGTVDVDELVANDERTAAFGSTVYGFRKAADKGLAPFDVLVVDEASQMKLGELALATMVLAPDGRLLLAGDDLQLPPIIQGSYPEREDGLPGLERSVFEYVRARDGGPTPYTCALLECWRMNATLCGFTAKSLYGKDYVPASEALRTRALKFAADGIAAARDEGIEWLTDPAWPLVVCMLDGVRASVDNVAEAAVVARIASALRAVLVDTTTGLRYEETEEGDRRFWNDGLFIVSPHHAQIRAIKTALARERRWLSEPFVDTVDKMQGQECQAVIVSYGVSDRETALAEAEFIYSLNRLNVAVTRAKAKCIVFLSQALLEPSFDLLSNEGAARGLGHMHELVSFCRDNGASCSLELRRDCGAAAHLVSALRSRWP